MILYTVMQADFVLSDNNSKERSFMEVLYKGEKIQVEDMGNNNYKVIRINSTSLPVYLDSKLLPGSILNAGEFSIY